VKIVYRASDIIEAHIVAGMLRAHDIEPHVGGHYLQGAVGDLAMDGFANVLVAEDDYDNAIDLVREYDNSAEQADASEAGADKVTDYKPWLA
jgi:Putative prokaryotic signal transducing protein